MMLGGKLMCTAATYKTKDFYFGKMENIIAERGYGNGRLMPYGFVIEREEI